MKTIEITSGDRKALFTTKSVTLDNIEYFYTKMSQVTHDTANCIYTFTYDGTTHTLPYEEKYAKVLSAIFSQVQKLSAQRQASAGTETPLSVKEAITTSDTSSDTVSSDVTDSDSNAASDAEVVEKPVKEKKEKVKKEIDPEKQAKQKKALIRFGIILGAIIVAAIIYFAVFGTSNDPSSVGPNSSESQQYEDIDQLIDDLQ